MKCVDCGEDVKDSSYLSHLREYHYGDKTLNVQCPSCNAHFKTVPTFQKHWYATHHVSKRKVSSVSSPSPSQENDQQNPSESADSVTASTTSQVLPETHVLPSSAEDSPVAKKARFDLSEIITAVRDGSSGCEAREVFPETPVVPTSREDSAISVSGHSSEPNNEIKNTEENSESEQLDCGSSDSSESSESEESDGEELLEGFEPTVSRSIPGTESSVNELAGEFMLNLKINCSIPIKSTNVVLSQTESLVKGALNDFVSRVNDKMKDKNLSLNHFVNVKDTIESTTKALFNNLRTDYQQNIYFKKKLGIVEPARYPLGREFRRVRRKRKASMQTVIVEEEFIYIPIDQVVEKLVGHPDYKRFVEEGSMSSRSSDVLDSYMRGEKWKQNSVLREHPDALRFVLYYDDLEVCAPLKSKAGKHKLGAFYMYLDNIPIKYRSNLDFIFVVGLVNANLVKGKKYGMDVALEHIVENLKKFEDGILLRNGQRVYGTLIATIGDNLGAHAVGGFKEGFTAHRLCRFCYATYEEVQMMTSEDEKLLRDKETHSRQCEKVQTARGKNEELSTEYGVNRDSLLNQLKSYHVIEGMPCDILHDILEGSLPLTVKRFLRHHLYEVPAKERKFTLDWLNAAISDFDYGYSEVTDKPSELKKDYITENDSPSLHQSGCQMWLLGTILPLILGPLIDIHDKYFQNLLDMLEITRIVFSTEVSKWMVAYLKDIIEEYLSDFISLYGALIPKQHFLVHYPRLMLLLGPLIHYICTRCEAKHKFFKKIVNSLGNYKYVSWTLSKRHQLCQSFAWSKSLLKKPKVGPFSWISTSEASYKTLISAGTLKVMEATWLQFNGVKFEEERCFICIGSNDSIPVFAKVAKILIYPIFQFVCQRVNTRCKNIHLAAYEVEVMSEYILIKPQDMLLPKVFHVHRALDKNFIIMKQCTEDAVF